MPPSCAELLNQAIQREDRESRQSSRKRSFRRSCVNRAFSIVSADPPFLALAGVSTEIAADANILAIISTMWGRTPYSRSFCSARAHSFSQPVSYWALSPLPPIVHPSSILLRTAESTTVELSRQQLTYGDGSHAVHQKTMNIKRVFAASIVLSWQPLGWEIAVQRGPMGLARRLASPPPSGRLPGISALHRASPNLVPRTVNALIAACPEYMAPAAIFNLRNANTPQTNAVSTLKWATGWFTIQFIELVLHTGALPESEN